MEQIPNVNMERLKIYHDNYTAVVTYSQTKNEKGEINLIDIISGKNLGQTHIIKDDGKRTCRFCGRSDSEVSFSKKAHAVSEFLGNKSLISYNECNDCNERLSHVEDDLSKFLLPFHSALFVKGKKGPPSYKTKGKTGRIDHDDKGFHIIQMLTGEKIYKEVDDHTMEINMHQQSYIPLKVFQALCKMAISTMPQSIHKNFQELIDWMNEPKLRPLLKQCGMFHGFITSPEINGDLTIMGWERKNDTLPVPYYILMILYSRLYICCFIPSEKDKHLFGKTIQFTPAPTLYDKQTHIDYIDLSSKDKKTDDIKFEMKFESKTLTTGFASEETKKIFERMQQDAEKKS